MLSLGSDIVATEARQDLTALVIEAHGGISRWNKVASIDVSFDFSGTALEKKGYPGHFQPTCKINIRNETVAIQGLGFGDREDRWIYSPKRVWIERQDGTIKAARDNPHVNFNDHTTATPWDDLDLTCFAGYALHNYLTFPFHLCEPGFQSREVDSHEENEERWPVLEVIFPDHYLAHSKVQLFYFDEYFMLRRIDYAPTAFKMPASHYCFDIKEICGLKFPTLRRVVARKPDMPMLSGVHALRGRSQLAGPTFFLLNYSSVALRDEDYHFLRETA